MRVCTPTCATKKCFVWVGLMLLVWDLFLSNSYLFLEDSGGSEKDLKIVYSSGPEKASRVDLLLLLFGIT